MNQVRKSGESCGPDLVVIEAKGFWVFTNRIHLRPELVKKLFSETTDLLVVPIACLLKIVGNFWAVRDLHH